MLKAYARAHEWGSVTIWMLPYRTLQTDIAISELNAIEPQLVYVNKKQKARTFEKPPELTAFEEKVNAFNDPRLKNLTGWETVNLWNVTHRTFIYCESLTVDIEFPDGALSAELLALRDYWQNRSANVAERWQVFKEIIGTKTCNAWWDAYNSTRDVPAPAPTALSEAEPKDPLPLSAGELSADPMTSS